MRSMVLYEVNLDEILIETHYRSINIVNYRLSSYDRLSLYGGTENSLGEFKHRRYYV